MASQGSASGDRIVRPRELPGHIGLSLPTIWRLRRRGDFPEPIKLSPGCVGWWLSVIDAWVSVRAKAPGMTGDVAGELLDASETAFSMPDEPGRGRQQSARKKGCAYGTQNAESRQRRNE